MVSEWPIKIANQDMIKGDYITQLTILFLILIIMSRFYFFNGRKVLVTNIYNYKQI